MKLIDEAVVSGARREAAAELVGLSVRTLQRWEQAGCEGEDQRHGPHTTPRNKLSMWERLQILDSVEFAHDELLPRLPRHGIRGKVVLHPVCSLRKMNLAGKLLRLAEACSDGAEVPLSAGCCGFAGDRGFRHPELTLSAMRAEAAEVAAGDYAGYFSSSRTCEIGLARATGRPYRHIWALLDEATRGGADPAAK